MLSINLVAVLLAAVVSFILGFLFHGPLLGGLWMKLADIHPTGNEKLSDMVPQMLYNVISNFFTALGLSVFYALASASPLLEGMGIMGGVVCGLIVWAGFLVTSSSIEVIWMGRKSSLWLFECGCSFVTMSVMGAIIAGM
jgi:hypothetical protein